VEPSPAERAVIKAVRRARLFVFLREHRHELLDEEFQSGLAGAYADSPKGQPFSKGTLVGFRARLIESDLDRRLVERTVEVADEGVRGAGAAGGAGLQPFVGRGPAGGHV
jgi:transposase